jgi:hypothetical protein
MNENHALGLFPGLQKMAHISSIVAQKPGKGNLNSSLPNSEEDKQMEKMREERKKETIELNSISDLQKMSFLEIKNLPISKCRGDIFEAALKQAIELEKTGSVAMIPKTEPNLTQQ